jgi:hypothetical protein
MGALRASPTRSEGGRTFFPFDSALSSAELQYLHRCFGLADAH